MTAKFVLMLLLMSLHLPAVSWAGRYEKGQGVPQDPGEAVKLYRRAAEHGNATAQYNLGVSYENGQGVAQDSAEAAKWYRLAADQGHPKAQYSLGISYDLGKGLPQDD